MKIPAGTTAYIGPPAQPGPKQVSEAIGAALGEIPEIVGAHSCHGLQQGTLRRLKS